MKVFIFNFILPLLEFFQSFLNLNVCYLMKINFVYNKLLISSNYIDKDIKFVNY
jgi:hypothetical protein